MLLLKTGIITGQLQEDLVVGINVRLSGVFKDAVDKFTKKAFDTFVRSTDTGTSLLLTKY